MNQYATSLTVAVGQCVDGDCNCDDGWKGEDCSIDGNRSPDIEVINGHDINKDPRRNVVTVLSDGFDTGSSYVCKVSKVSVIYSFFLLLT